MFLVITSSADTYITDKIISAERAVSGNVGLAGTIDLFKLWDESTVITSSVELSRGLLSFDWSQIQSLTSSSLDLNSFKAYLRMTSIVGGQPAPNDFTLSVFPLSSSFTEGIGRDVSSYSQIGSANFLSRSNGLLWNASGAAAGGLLGSPDIDYIASGNFNDGLGLRSFETTQRFINGNEDLYVEITDFVSASIVGLLPQPSFRVSFTGSQETDTTTYFVKRFGSRNTRNPLLRPRVEVFWDDSRIDDREQAIFDVSGSLYLTNTVRGARANLVSGSGLSSVVGSNCLLVRFTTGSYTKYFTGSQEQQSGYSTGVYKTPFIFASSDTSVISGSVTLNEVVRVSGSITFEEIWTSLDQNVVFKSGSLTVNSNTPDSYVFSNDKLKVSCFGPSSSPPGLVLIRCKFFDLALEDRSSKFAIERKPVPVSGLFRIVDSQSKQIYIDFNSIGTKLSLDQNGNFIQFYSDSIPYGRSVYFEFKIDYNGENKVISDEGYTFSLRS